LDLKPFLYPIVDTAVCRARGLDPIAFAEHCLRGGARLLQLRAKGESSGTLLELADRLVAAARATGAGIVVNDRSDIAVMAASDGVHVGQEDLPVEAAREIVGANRIVGVSTHTRDQIDRALESSATYVAVGPIFNTDTKDTGYSARGLELVTYAAGRGKPVVAIGGITLERAPAILAAGASGLAVITDLLTGNDPEKRVRAFVAALALSSSPESRAPNPEPRTSS
jgi:thiamine-phosphate pyrophosphorylase